MDYDEAYGIKRITRSNYLTKIEISRELRNVNNLDSTLISIRMFAEKRRIVLANKKASCEKASFYPQERLNDIYHHYRNMVEISNWIWSAATIWNRVTFGVQRIFR